MVKIQMLADFAVEDNKNEWRFSNGDLVKELIMLLRQKKFGDEFVKYRRTLLFLPLPTDTVDTAEEPEMYENSSSIQTFGSDVFVQWCYVFAVSQAVSMDSLEEGSLTSSMVDDAFFVVKKCTRYS